MIVILEGPNGVGKSAYAKAISVSMEAPIVRPFRPADESFHWGRTSLEAELNSLDVPVNTHVDDLYVGTILEQLNISRAVLDRSMPSALAYSDMDPDKAKRLYGFWMVQLGRLKAHVVYVNLWAARQSAVDRVGDRWIPEIPEWNVLCTKFVWLYSQWPGDKLLIDTDDISLAEGVGRILSSAHA